MQDERFQIEQATVTASESARRRRSPGFRDEWEPELRRVIDAFGTPSPGVRCPEAIFACPFSEDRIAVVRVSDSAGRLAFHFLVLGRELYAMIGEPFALVDRFPAAWEDGAALDTLFWPEELAPERTVEQLQTILKDGNSPLLLGATQILVDNGRLILERAEPDPDFARHVWALLPHSTRAETFPSTFAFSAELEFHLLITPVRPRTDARYLVEEQALGYPDSRYERHLQIAIEEGDQRSLNRLFARRSSSETLRLALMLIVGFMVLSLVMRMLN